jgi:hypothetical protein
MPIDPATWAFLRDLGFGGLATFALIGGWKGLYVWRREHDAALSQWQQRYDAVKADRDYYRAALFRALGHTEQALEVAAAKTTDA